MVFAYAAARRSRSHLVAAITKRKNHANPLRGSGYFIRIRIYRRSFSYQRHRAVCSVMASLVANGFSPGGVGGGPKAVRPPRPPPPLRGKTKGGFSYESCLLPSGFFQLSNLGGLFRFLCSVLAIGLIFIFWGSIMYSPNFSELAAVTVRRLAWAMGANMGQAVDVLVKALPAYIKTEKVCELCRDKTKCNACAIKNSGEMPQKAKALLY